jgi:hypothetical protein
MLSPYLQDAPRGSLMRKTSKARKKISTLSASEVTNEEAQREASIDAVPLTETSLEQKKKEARKALYLTRYE